MVKPIKPNIGL